MKFSHFLAAILGLAGLWPLSAADSLPYQAPDFHYPLPEGTEYSAELRTQIFELLMQIVEHPETDARVRGMSMYLAYHISHPIQLRALALRDFELRFDRELGISYLADPPPAAATLHFQLAGLAAQLDKVNPQTEYFQDLVAALTSQAQTHSTHWSSVFSKSIATGAQLAASGPTRGDGFSRRQSLIKGLVVVQLQGAYAGKASQMNATVLPSDRNETTVGFNQSVGKDMIGGLARSKRFISTRHSGLPPKGRIEISFEEQYRPKDGPSASVACALLLESLVTGIELDPGFAVTGDLDEKGIVGPVGGISGKIRGAAARQCTHVAIPEENTESILDLLLIEGIDYHAKVQIFTISSFEEALALAQNPGRSSNLQEAMDKYATIQTAFARNGYDKTMLRNPQVQQRLREVIDLAPNHASAKALMLLALGREPKSLSTYGSMDAIDRAIVPLIQGMRTTNFGLNNKGTDSVLDNDEFADAVYSLRRARPILDQRTWKVVDAFSELTELLRQLKNDPPQSITNYNRLVDQINRKFREVDKAYELLSEELGYESEDEE